MTAITLAKPTSYTAHPLETKPWLVVRVAHKIAAAVLLFFQAIQRMFMFLFCLNSKKQIEKAPPVKVPQIELTSPPESSTDLESGTQTPSVEETSPETSEVEEVPQAKSSPIEKKQGLKNLGANCAFNSVVHFLQSDPAISQLLRKPLPQGSDRNSQILHGAYNQFFRLYDEKGRDVVSSQDLRIAAHEVNPDISESHHRNEDASEILAPILEMLPEPDKISIQTQYILNTDGLPDPGEPVAPRQVTTPMLTLAYDDLPPEQVVTLTELLDAHLHPQGFESLTKEDIYGKRQKYPIKQAIVQFTRAPSVLRLQISRFEMGENGPIKKDHDIAIPEEITLPVADGTQHRYRLTSFVQQCGTLNHGHYTAGRIIDGQKIIFDDTNVRTVEEERWQQCLQQAYLLCYLP
jgi:ubiquitin C-terminal hydrolase